MTLSIGPTPLDSIVDAIDDAFLELGVCQKRFTRTERIYLQLHLLVSLHNVLIDVRSGVFEKVTGILPATHQAMLPVSAMDDTLSVDIAFYYYEDGKHLEQAALRSPDRFERFRWPLISTNLDEKKYLLESDLNIRCCLYNRPLLNPTLFLIHGGI